MGTPLGKIFHLFSRFGFGISYKQANELTQVEFNEIVERLFVFSANPQPITEINFQDIPLKKDAMAQGMNKKELQKLISDKLRDLNIAWTKRLLVSEKELVEKQTLFWHNHFSCRINDPYLMQELNNIHRRLALSNFRDLLMEVSKSPAMLNYLNNQQNKKQHPNENFARELMELFTLGRGNYSEQDVKEVARAFTGWSFNKETASFDFKAKQHDDQEKTIFNMTGNFGGEHVINMILNNKQTAYFLCTKMYRYYVNEVVNEEHVKELADFYYHSQYNTGALLRKIMQSSWFYSVENAGAIIKSPIDYLVVMSRQFKITYTNYNVLFQLQRALGQQLFYPPNVAGWPGGKTFIDSTTLLLRMKLPSVILNNGELEVADKIDDPDDQVKLSPLVNKKYETEVQWQEILNEISAFDFETLMSFYLLKMPSQEIITRIKSDSVFNKKEMILKIVSLPEYNLM
ncbi:hypothetical protein CNR22_13375 [Sphingobacteriaceae bacterium]|nr:hypothetical protein CNR22_13375 [Sphingobacteriaceae bacterium]